MFTLSVYNAVGELVCFNTELTFLTTVDLSFEERGMYFVRILGENINVISVEKLVLD